MSRTTRNTDDDGMYVPADIQPGTSYALALLDTCGTADESQDVELYDGTLGVPVSIVVGHQSPVGQLMWGSLAAFPNPGNVAGQRWASGTLVSHNLFLTAAHNFEQGGPWTFPIDPATGGTVTPQVAAVNMVVNFNFQLDPSGVPRPEVPVAITRMIEFRPGGLDFAIVELAGEPGLRFDSATTVEYDDAVAGEVICIIGHPLQAPKRVDAGSVHSTDRETIRYADVDTQGGNSGSGIVRMRDGNLVGIHTNGGCTQPGGTNRGIRIGFMQVVSQTLRQLVVDRRFPLTFVVEFYISANPDIRAAYGSSYRAARRHWDLQGLPNEGRRGSVDFDVRYYLDAYPDIRDAFGTDYRGALGHWANQGLPQEARRGSLEFDVRYYLAAYPDIRDAFGTDYRAAAGHWATQGFPNEGRRGSIEFDVRFYLSFYPDIRDAFGSCFRRAAHHWVNQGLPNEGRRGSLEFDVRYYLDNNPDIRDAFGTDYRRAAHHWANQGLPNEGRRGSIDFDVRYYLDNNPDVRDAYGTNYRAAAEHWIRDGIAQGRKGAP